MIVRVGHLYPEYLNIYADRGNIAVLQRRAGARGHELELEPVTLGTSFEPGTHDLLYVGGGQDREQAMIAADLAVRGDDLRAAVDGGAALLAVCGGYQLLGRGYRGRDGAWMAGAGLFPHETLAGETRMIGDVLLASTLPEAAGKTIAGFENHAGRTMLDLGRRTARSRRRRLWKRRSSGFEGCRVGRALGTYLHGPLLPRNPWIADLLLSWAIAHATGSDPEPLEALDDSLEDEAHAVAAARARARGGRPA